MRHVKTYRDLSESKAEKVWYHGSDRPVKKFLFSLIGKNSKRITNYHGYGIYFIDDEERAKSYGSIVTRMTIDASADILENKVTAGQLSKVQRELVKEGVDLSEDEIKFFDSPTYGEYSILNDVEEFYDIFMRRYGDNFRSIKDVTEFLLRAGIDGMRVINDVEDNIMVVFNEKIIKIV